MRDVQLALSHAIIATGLAYTLHTLNIANPTEMNILIAFLVFSAVCDIIVSLTDMLDDASGGDR